MPVSFTKSDSDYVDFGQPAVLEFDTALTIMCWVFRPDGGQESGLIYHGGGWSDDGWGLHWTGGTTLRFEMQNAGGTPKIATDFTVPYSEWHHVAATWSRANNQMRKFLDGVDQGGPGTFAADLSPPEVNLRFASVTSQGRYATMLLADARAYDRALSAVELATIVAMQGADGITDGLKLRCLLNEGYPGQVVSGSGAIKDGAFGNDGTPGSTPEWVEGTIMRYRKRRAM